VKSATVSSVATRHGMVKLAGALASAGQVVALV
jgi:septal ring factor EnvC (AmiA/AmiB activator)